jgi:alkylhydroperoxidase family enzyme
LSSEFASTWRQYELDLKTHALLEYAQSLTEAPAMVGDSEIEKLHAAGWDERGVYEATVLISFFNMSGRIEAVSGLPPDEIPENSSFDEAVDDRGQVRVPA